MVQFDLSIELGAVKIWNYNKGILDCIKGVKEVAISLNGEHKW